MINIFYSNLTMIIKNYVFIFSNYQKMYLTYKFFYNNKCNYIVINVILLILFF